MTRRFLGPRAYALFALGFAAFTLYGSYVPFHHRERPWHEATGAFAWAMEHRLAMESRSDWAANCLLGAPLGFCLLAALRVDKTVRPTTAILGLALLPLCVAFAAAVEFGQLYFPGRTCAGSDVWAQGLGSAVGVFAWILGGQWMTDKLRGAFGPPGERGNPAVLLLAYGAFVLLVQLLPLDLSISPSVLYHKTLDPGQTTLVPLAEFDRIPNRPPPDDGKKIQNWLELIALSWPLGALASRLPGKWGVIDGLPRLVGSALATAAILELGQLAVASRHPSSTDVIVLTFGIFLGWAAALSLADRGVRKYRLEVALVLGQLWFCALGVIQWQPFDFQAALLGERLGDLDWMPMAGQANKNYLWALNEVLEKFVLFAPIGALAVWAKKTVPGRPGVIVPVLISGAIAAALEFGQAMIPSRTASPTDLFFGLVGGWIGAEVVRRTAGARRELGFSMRPGRVARPAGWNSVVAPRERIDG